MYAGGCTYLCSQGLTDRSTHTKRCSEATTLFGPHAKFTLQNSPPAVEDETMLMQKMRARLGPYASETALQYHLRAARGKVFWAVNTYFRAVLAEQVWRADFEPRQYAELANTHSPEPQTPTQDLRHREQLDFNCIPAQVLEGVLQCCNLLTVCNAAATCKSLHQAANSNLVWKHLYTQRWGMLTESVDKCLQTIESSAVQQQKHFWQNRYKSRHQAEYAMQCPACQQSKIIPIVYGFPSHLLVRNMRANKLRMGNDHLIEGQPVWICSSCSHEFSDFPYNSVEIPQH